MRGDRVSTRAGRREPPFRHPSRTLARVRSAGGRQDILALRARTRARRAGTDGPLHVLRAAGAAAAARQDRASLARWSATRPWSGSVQQDRDEMEVLFTLLAHRHEQQSVLLTSNLVFSEWERIFRDPMTKAAAIDRLVHHSVIPELNLPSYRMEAAKRRRSKTTPSPTAAAAATLIEQADERRGMQPRGGLDLHGLLTLIARRIRRYGIHSTRAVARSLLFHRSTVRQDVCLICKEIKPRNRSSEREFQLSLSGTSN